VNSERLAELQRQRALVRDHLAWLDGEIASATGALPAASPNPVAPPPSAAAEPALFYEPDPVSAQLSARRGCFLYFAAAVFLFVLALGAIYFLRYRDHPLLFSTHDSGASAEKASSNSSRK